MKVFARMGFNPHPSRRTGATLTSCPNGWSEPVSILTRPEGRVQLQRVARIMNVPGFNPHPSRRTGATRIRQSVTRNTIVSILTRPEGRVQPPQTA